MTEDEAKKKWCCGDVTFNGLCAASSCMAWRGAVFTKGGEFQYTFSGVEPHPQSDAKEVIDRGGYIGGYCGLARRPA